MKSIKYTFAVALLFLSFLSASLAVLPAKVAAEDAYSISDAKPKHQCGNGEGAIKMSIGVGCYGDKCNGEQGEADGAPANFCTGNKSAGVDLTFAFIRFLSNGVGLVLIGSLLYAGIQYTFSRDEPQAVASAQGRIKSVLMSLVLYIFAYALLNYLIPGQFLKQ